MKSLKYLIGATSVLMVASFAGSPASAGVTGTPHDLTVFTADAGTEQVCVYCHTPHNGAQGSTDANQIAYNTLPLWNRQADGGTVTTFQTYTSPTLDAGTANVAGQPVGVTLGCLSCHDGATALDSLIVTDEAAALSTPGSTLTDVALNPNSVLGGDLRNDHPVSIQYDAGGQGTSDWIATPVLPLYGASNDQVECASCHNPHDNDVVAANDSKFLRISNASSNLCLACHVK